MTPSCVGTEDGVWAVHTPRLGDQLDVGVEDRLVRKQNPQFVTW